MSNVDNAIVMVMDTLVWFVLRVPNLYLSERTAERCIALKVMMDIEPGVPNPDHALQQFVLAVDKLKEVWKNRHEHDTIEPAKPLNNTAVTAKVKITEVFWRWNCPNCGREEYVDMDPAIEEMETSCLACSVSYNVARVHQNLWKVA